METTQVKNPKTTVAGYLGMLGMLFAGIGQIIPGKTGSMLTMIGIALTGSSNAVGNISSQDGSH